MCNLQLKWLSDVITVLLRVVKKKKSIVLKYGTWMIFLSEDMIFKKSVFIDMRWFYRFEFPSDGKIIYRCSMSPVLSCTHKQVCILIYVHSRPIYLKSFSQIRKYLCSGFSLLMAISATSVFCFFPPVSPLCASSLLKPLPCPHLLLALFPFYLHSPSTPFLFSWIKCSFTPCVLNCISFCLDSFLPLNCFSPLRLLSKLIFSFQYPVQCWRVQCLINIC